MIMGWIAALLLLLGMGKKSDTPSVPPGSTGPIAPLPPPNAGDAFGKRLAELLNRAKGGLRWVPLFDAALKQLVPELSDIIRSQWAGALGRWAGIESGGNPLAKSSLSEIGLLQIGIDTLASLVSRGVFSRAEAAAMRDPKTSDTTHADFAVRFFLSQTPIVRQKAPDYVDPLDVVWGAKMQHALPLMLTELSAQAILGTGRDDAHRNYPKFRPSPRLLSFGKPATAQGLFDRFYAGADVVADGDNAVLRRAAND